MSKFLIAAITTASFVAPTLTLADETWTGFHIGLNVGTSQVGLNVGTSQASILSLDDSSAIYGVQAGYSNDFGAFVLGGELDYSTAEHDLVVGNQAFHADVDTLRLKLRGGFDLGKAMVYGVVGVASLDSETGSTIGLGINYMATKNIIIGAEILRDSVDVAGDVSGIGIDVDSLSFRASYKF